MNHFTELCYVNIDGRRIRLAKDFTFWVSENEAIIVPEGFECDGQSYPRLLQMIDTPQGRGAKAGVCHDYLYWLNCRPAGNGKNYDRKAADDVYFRALQASGINAVSCRIRYRALRLFGWAAWNAHAKRISEENLKVNKPAETTA